MGRARIVRKGNFEGQVGQVVTTRLSMNWGSTSPVGIRMNAPGLRNALGQYQAREQQAISAARNANERLAREMQNRVIDEVGSYNRRPSTGRLRKALSSPRNLFVADSGQSWGFLNVAYMNRSSARYWRTIDEGSAATFSRGGMIGMKIYPQIFPNRPARLSRRLAWYSGVTPDNQFAGRPDTPNPRGKIRAVTAATGLDFEARYPGYEPIIIGKEIEPHNYLEKAYGEMLPEIRQGRAWKVALDTAWKAPGK